MLTAITNAQRVNKERVVIPYSKEKLRLAEFLQTEGMLVKLRVKEGEMKKIVITLGYEGGQPVIKRVKRLSKPGRRKYVKKQDLPYTGNRPGLYVISTSQGLMNQTKAKMAGLGGELVCELWKTK